MQSLVSSLKAKVLCISFHGLEYGLAAGKPHLTKGGKKTKGMLKEEIDLPGYSEPPAVLCAVL